MDINKVIAAMNKNKSKTERYFNKIGIKLDERENIILPLSINGEGYLGEISYNGMKALEEDNLDNYTPISDEEKNTLNKYKNYLSKMPIDIKINDNKTINLKYGVIKQFDDVVKQNSDKSDRKIAKLLDEKFKELNLTGDEYNSAYSYMGLKKNEVFSKEKPNTWWKEILAYPAKFVKGLTSAVDGTVDFLEQGERSKENARLNRYYNDNPDEFGNDYYNADLQFRKPSKTRYMNKATIDKTLVKPFENINNINKFISDAVAGTLGDIVGSATIGQMAGLNQAFSGVGIGVKEMGRKMALGSAIKGGVPYKISNSIIKTGKFINKTPNVNKVLGSKTIGNVLNKVSIGSTGKFLSPIASPTTMIMGANAGREKYEQLLTMGYDEETAKNNALFTAYVNTVTEKMGFSNLDDVSKFGANIVANRGKNISNSLKNYLGQSVEEGVEEIFATGFDRLGDIISNVGYIDKDGTIKSRPIVGNEGIFDVKALGESFLGGMVGGAALGATGIISQLASKDYLKVKEYGDEVSTKINEIKKIVETTAKEANIDLPKMPQTIDFKNSTPEQIEKYYNDTVNILKEIVSNDDVILHDRMTYIKNLLEAKKNELESNVNQEILSEMNSRIENVNNIILDKTKGKDIIEDENSFTHFNSVTGYPVIAEEKNNKVTVKNVEGTTYTYPKNVFDEYFITIENAKEQAVENIPMENEFDELMATDTSDISIGDVYVAKDTGNKITILDEKDNTIKIQIDNGKETVVRNISNNQAKRLTTNNFENIAKLSLDNSGINDKIKSNENRGVNYGEERTIYLSNSIDGPDRQGRTKEIDKNLGKSKEKREKTQQGNEISYILSDNYSLEMQNIVTSNKLKGLNTQFFDGLLYIKNTKGEIVQTIDKGCFNNETMTIFINPNSSTNILNINSHEIIHAIKKRNSKLYEDLYINILQNVYVDEFQKAVATYLEIISKKYETKVHFDIATEELICNLSYEIYSNNIPSYIADIEGVKKAYENYIDEYKSEITQLTTNDVSNVKGNKQSKHSLNNSFNEEIDNWLKGTMQLNDIFRLGETPSVLQQIGAQNLPLIMSQSVMEKITGGKHNIAIDTIKQIPSAITKPIMVFSSATVPNAYVILTELQDKKGNDVVVALHLNKKEGRLHINRISSVYGKENISNFVKKQIENGNLKYFDKIKSQAWATSRGLQLPKLVQSIPDNNNILQKEDIVNKYFMRNNKNNSLEREGDTNVRNIHSDTNMGQQTSENTTESVKRVGGKSKETRTDVEQRSNPETNRRIYAKNVRDNEQITTEIRDRIKADFVDPNAYSDEMNEIVANNNKRGLETFFFVGSGFIKFGHGKQVRGAIVANKRIYIQCDNVNYSPKQINQHELVHKDYSSKKIQKIKNIISNSLSITEKNRIINELYKNYHGLAKGNEEYIFEEFVADVLSGMSEYSKQFEKISNDYWDNKDIVQYYNPGTYAESIDSGGFIDNVGFGDVPEKLSIRYGNDDNSNIVIIDENIFEGQENEKPYKVIKNYLKNNIGKYATIIESGQRVYLGKDLPNEYTQSKYTKSLNKKEKHLEDAKYGWYKYSTVLQINDKIYNADLLIRNDANGKKYLYDLINIKKIATQRGENTPYLRTINKDRTDISETDNLNNATITRKNNDVNSNIRKKHLNDTDARYSIDNDMESFSAERQKELDAYFNRDSVKAPKASKKELWGERFNWVVANTLRVFEDIPERGAKGTFFAEFRKSMIQWTKLPKTAMFMTQDKLHKITKDLSPKEFETFSKLVYYLDLQEEAKMQKERGYDEILLPNEISPKEIDLVLAKLEKDTTPNIKAALKNRKNIWDDLKSKYIELNGILGFNTDNKFTRENYYRHQVIEYMSDNKDVGTGNKKVEIKTNRGWLKERQGSTKAINTDFLAVEYQAMLQMQYDIYIANTLVKIVEKYDIKPQLINEAFNNNKKALNNMIKAEPQNGELSEQQKFYNKRIMFGFRQLIELAQENKLIDLNGVYKTVVNALKKGDLNAVQQSLLYRYIGELASTENEGNIGARIVLKYTSQKKAWVKNTLKDNYQTWESLARERKEDYGIFQPRRGNYFYTKNVVDEDAFNKTLNNVVVSMIEGQGVEMTSDLKSIFEEHADTVKLIGASYQQMVLPNEIIITMEKVANPKQVGRGTKAFRGMNATWKGWSTSVNPLRTLKFGIRNLFGDLDAVIAGKPQLLKYTKKASIEIYNAMRHKEYTPNFLEWVERGGYSSMIFANEMDTEMQDKLFAHLKDKKGKSILSIPVNIMEGYLNGVETAHNFRESILRYSAYLYFKEDLTKGKLVDNVASNRYIVKGLESNEDKAYQLSKDLLGAYDEVSKLGQHLRRYWVPFYSFTETNLKRYYRLFENIIMSDDSIPKKSAKLILKALMANLLTLLLIAWNKLVKGEDEEKLPPSVKAVPHLTLGSIEDNIYAFTRLGSFNELLEWFGYGDYEFKKDDIYAPVNKAFGMLSPFFKMPIELVSGLNFYPELTKPRAIRDKWEHFFNSLGLAEVYKNVAGKPTKGVGNIVENALIYKYDYKDTAYYEILDRKREYQKKDDNTIYGVNDKANALYYAKLAIRYKDKKAALKYIDEYFAKGGTGKGIIQSFSTLNPLYGYTSKEGIKKGEEFVKALTEDEKVKLKIAQDYWEDELQLPKELSKKLGKKGLTDEQAKNLLINYINYEIKE